MMKIMALQILRELAKNPQDAGFYSVIEATNDEATDVSNVFQLAAHALYQK